MVFSSITADPREKSTLEMMAVLKKPLQALFLLLCPLFALHIPYNVSTGTATTTAAGPICIDSSLYPQWATSRLLPKDCFAAVVVAFYGHEMQHGHQIFEFVAPRASSRTRYLFQRTPRKYIYGSCVMAIAMLSTFEPGQVPGLGIDLQRSRTDVATYEDIWNAVKGVLDTCIEKYCEACPHGFNFLSTVGWNYAGAQQDIGVFFFDVNSAINRIIASGRTVLVKSPDLPSLGATKASTSRSLNRSSLYRQALRDS